MSEQSPGLGPHERAHPGGRRTPSGARVDSEADDSHSRRAVLSIIVENEPGVTAEVTGLFARRQVNIERIVGEPMGDGDRSRITFVVEPPHPGVDQVTAYLQRLRPVVSVEEHDLDTAQRLTAAID